MREDEERMETEAVPEEAVPKTAATPFCRFCGAPLPAGARRCNACELWQDRTRPCINCGDLLPELARYCPDCESYQEPDRECVACGVFMPAKAKVCPKCGGVQSFNGFLNIGQVTLTLLIALLSVLGTAGPVVLDLFEADRSDTSFELLGMDEAAGQYQLVVLASNAGNRDSYLRRVRIEFPKFPAADRELDIVASPEERMLKPGTTIVRLESRDGFPFKDLGIEDRSNPNFTEKLLDGGQVLKAEIVGVNEEDEAPKEVETSTKTRDVLRAFVDRRAG